MNSPKIPGTLYFDPTDGYAWFEPEEHADKAVFEDAYGCELGQDGARAYPCDVAAGIVLCAARGFEVTQVFNASTEVLAQASVALGADAFELHGDVLWVRIVDDVIYYCDRDGARGLTPRDERFLVGPDVQVVELPRGSKPEDVQRVIDGDWSARKSLSMPLAQTKPHAGAPAARLPAGDDPTLPRALVPPKHWFGH